MDIESVGFQNALENLCSGMDDLNNCRIKKKIPDTPLPNLDKQQKINIYRIIQEALHNTIKHSGASEAILEITKDDEILCVIIEDNGRGNQQLIGIQRINTEKRRPRGLGLQSMKYRTHQLSADFRFESSSRQGTRIETSVPLKGKENEQDPVSFS